MLHVYNKVTYLTIVLSRESSRREVDHCTMTGCAVKSAASDCPVSYGSDSFLGQATATVSDHETDHPTANREMQVRFCTSSLPM